MPISNQDIQHLFERLRSGVVPDRGLEAFAVGTDKPQNEIKRQLDLASNGEGVFKFLRGGYGCGKTFTSRLALQDAQDRDFATSFVVVSDNDLHFHRFDDVYRKVVQELGTSECKRGALGFIIDCWLGRVQDALFDAGVDPYAENFDDKVQQRIQEDLASLTKGKAPEDMVRVLRAIFKLKQNNDMENASALISWLSGSRNVATQAMRIAGIRGRISSNEAMAYLQGVLAITKAAGYKGLVIVIDEAETILRMRTDIRAKSLNGIRQICDAADRYRADPQQGRGAVRRRQPVAAGQGSGDPDSSQPSANALADRRRKGRRELDPHLRRYDAIAAAAAGGDPQYHRSRAGQCHCPLVEARSAAPAHRSRCRRYAAGGDGAAAGPRFHQAARFCFRFFEAASAVFVVGCALAFGGMVYFPALWAIDSLFEIGQHPSVAPVILHTIGDRFSGIPLLDQLGPYFDRGFFDPIDLVAGLAGALLAFAALRFSWSANTRVRLR